MSLAGELNRVTGMYLDLLKATLTGMNIESVPMNQPWLDPGRPYNAEDRYWGRDWPSAGQTMIGYHRMQNVQDCLFSVLDDDIPGDVMECGVWRGGTCIFMRAMLEALGDKQRKVWVADSFQGLPRESAGNDLLMVSLARVKGNFRLYGMLDDRVKFIEGWFDQSLPGAPVEQLSLLRLDGDQYESQWPILEHMYPRLSPGGYVIIDDYPGIVETMNAVDEYRQREGITTPIQQAGAAGWWRKE